MHVYVSALKLLSPDISYFETRGVSNIHTLITVRRVYHSLSFTEYLYQCLYHHTLEGKHGHTIRANKDLQPDISHKCILKMTGVHVLQSSSLKLHVLKRNRLVSNIHTLITVKHLYSSLSLSFTELISKSL